MRSTFFLTEREVWSDPKLSFSQVYENPLKCPLDLSKMTELGKSESSFFMFVGN